MVVLALVVVLFPPPNHLQSLSFDAQAKGGKVRLKSLCTGWRVETCWDLVSTAKGGMLVNDFSPLSSLWAPHYGGRSG